MGLMEIRLADAISSARQLVLPKLEELLPYERDEIMIRLEEWIDKETPHVRLQMTSVENPDVPAIRRALYARMMIRANREWCKSIGITYDPEVMGNGPLVEPLTRKKLEDYCSLPEESLSNKLTILRTYTSKLDSNPELEELKCPGTLGSFFHLIAHSTPYTKMYAEMLDVGDRIIMGPSYWRNDLNIDAQGVVDRLREMIDRTTTPDPDQKCLPLA
ncbi:hypothetical protein GOV11_04065 [Candidatus Woesearchaeota archaeon]|nr:hypothetical protein [Candidatus Woesearchaeota archaeon]